MSHHRLLQILKVGLSDRKEQLSTIKRWISYDDKTKMEKSFSNQALDLPANYAKLRE